MNTIPVVRWFLCSCLAGMLGLSSHVAMAASAPEWSFRASPYIWFAGLKGEVATLPPAQPVEVDVSFSDILDKVDMAFMGAFEARRGRFGFVGEVVYMGLSADADTPGPLFSGVDYESDLWAITAAATYSLAQEEDAFLDLLVGLTLWDADNKLEFNEGAIADRKIAEQESWVDPVVGMRGRMRLKEKWFLAAHGFIEVAGDSDSAWDLHAGVGYDLGETYSLIVGYRHKEVDYEDDGFVFDVELSGPMIGLSIRF